MTGNSHLFTASARGVWQRVATPPTQLGSQRIRKQKTDRQHAQHILKLMVKDDFPKDLGAELGESGRAATGLPTFLIWQNLRKGCFRQGFAVCSILDKSDCISESAAASPFARSAVI